MSVFCRREQVCFISLLSGAILPFSVSSNLLRSFLLLYIALVGILGMGNERAMEG